MRHNGRICQWWPQSYYTHPIFLCMFIGLLYAIPLCVRFSQNLTPPKIRYGCLQCPQKTLSPYIFKGNTRLRLILGKSMWHFQGKIIVHPVAETSVSYSVRTSNLPQCAYLKGRTFFLYSSIRPLHFGNLIYWNSVSSTCASRWLAKFMPGNKKM